MPGRKYAASGLYKYGFNGKENDSEIKSEADYVDFGARMYDSRIGRWMSIDKKADGYTSFSPYNFALNTPIQAFDPDGNLVIFVNGYWGFPTPISEGASVHYWGEKWVEKVQKNLNDVKQAKFYDGSLGGPKGIIISNTPLNRALAGQERGYSEAKSIVENLTRDANGNIIETIKFVTNSMGAAYQRGFSTGLMSYVNEQNKAINEFNDGLDNKITLLKIQRSNIVSQLDQTPMVFTTAKNSAINTQIAQIDAAIDHLNKQKKKPLDVKIEIVVDLDAHQIESKDPNAQKSYFMLSDPKSRHPLENVFVEPKAIKGAVQIGINAANGESLMKGHHSIHASTNAFKNL